MTTVIIKGRYGAKGRETDLVSALTPDSFSHGGDQVERLVSATDLHAEIIGRLLAWMVERHAMSLAEANKILGSYDDMEIVP